VSKALESRTQVGAHPSYPDRTGFGRRAMAITPSDLLRSLQEQIGALVEVARSCGTTVTSVKPHGALYAEVARGADECAALLDAIGSVCEPGTSLVLPAGAPALEVVAAAGVPVLREGFCDRAYAGDGSLVPRRHEGAVYDDPRRAADQALSLGVDGTVRAEDGSVVSVQVDSLCLHGDSPNVLAMAREVRRVLRGAGVTVAAAARP
jgi:UPF0271 protein